MSYSCSDFTDDLIGAFHSAGLIKNSEIEDDDPSQQCDVVVGALRTLLEDRDALLAALKTMVRAFHLPDDLRRVPDSKCEAMDGARAAIARPRRKPYQERGKSGSADA